jgi:hypothetical protein
MTRQWLIICIPLGGGFGFSLLEGFEVKVILRGRESMEEGKVESFA